VEQVVAEMAELEPAAPLGQQIQAAVEVVLVVVILLHILIMLEVVEDLELQSSPT
jgi:hypothetical protein